MSGITQLGAESAQESQSNSDSGSNQEYEWDRFDLTGSYFGMQHPVTAVEGTAVALRQLYDENDPRRSDVAVILDDPSVVTDDENLEGSVVVHGDEDESDDFKVVNSDDDATKIPNDGMIDFDGNTFYGDIEDDFGDMDRIALKRGGGAGRRITRVLDVNGATRAEALIERDDGEITNIELGEDGFPKHNGGLVEYDPDPNGQLPVYSLDPELRDDVEGQSVIVMVQRLADVNPDYEGGAYWATVFANLADDRQDELAESYDDAATIEIEGTEYLQLEPTDEFERDEANLAENGWISWNGIDRSDASEVRALNQARLDADFGSVYVPEGIDVSDAVPDDVADSVTTSPTEDDWSGETDQIPAFGGGV